MSSVVRTRYAPSPTGYMHIGNLRTALYEYLIAKSNGGKFILRIEDTDQSRYIEGAVDFIYKALDQAGIRHDEGPDIGGEYGPYTQSQRKGSYLKHALALIEKGEAYYCFCSREKIEDDKKAAEAKGEMYVYDGHCSHLSPKETEEKRMSGIPYVIRQKMPKEGTSDFTDAVYGDISVPNKELEDQILIKSDGFPTYNFANVVDDHEMKITHVVRGCEYIISTPKYNLLYQAFGWDVPVYIHLPHIVREDGKKLSKREGDCSFEDLMQMGFLPQAIVNYIALLGWSPEGTQEIFSLSELEKVFSIDRISKSESTFDMVKLRWFNGEYFKKMSLEEFHHLASPYYPTAFQNKFDLMKISRILQQRIDVLNEIPGKVDFFEELCDYDMEIYLHKKMKTTYNSSLSALEAAVPVLEELTHWDEESIHQSLMDLVQQLGIKNGQMLWPVRTAISGKPITPGGAFEIADILGKKETLRRISIGMDRLKEITETEGI